MPDKQTFVIRSKAIRHSAAQAVFDITSDPLMQVVISEYKKSKTHEQLGYLWGVILPTIREHIEGSTGDHYSNQDIYDWFISEYADQSVVTINGRPRVTTVSASRMDTQQMSDFMTKIIQMAAEDLDCVIPWPEVGMSSAEE